MLLRLITKYMKAEETKQKNISQRISLHDYTISMQYDK